ncbi:Adenylate kinase [Aquisphaera giovannonii]|uniref:Adenylate kinase n=1 Tax=Aquisphaera giovannonii TaxID=406548 RepID=A0A5B9WDQ3_9BACT|nr:nucleoside monophosphate kinase [Aquisphaera giovannonii]QEH38359.1 Adenylate kinase [Aquisphaera giovannonii]
MNTLPDSLAGLDEPATRYHAYLLFGMPGSGKGTQGAVLGQLPSLRHISMGDIFRKIPKYGRIGREIEQYTSQGRMVPDELTVRIFRQHLHILELQELLIADQHTLILDGLPRCYAQAEMLSSVIEVVQIFHLGIKDTKVAMERMKARALRENRLDDMNEEVIRRRLNTYYEDTYKTLSFYPPEIVYDVDAGQCMIDVLRDIVNRLAEVKTRSLAVHRLEVSRI